MDLTRLLIEKLATPLAVVLIRSVASYSAGTIGGGLTGIVAQLVKNRYEQRKLERQWEEMGERIVQRLEPLFQQAVNEGGGQALLLFDGVDEVPPDRRDEVRWEIEQIVRAYPRNWFLVSTRPAAVPEGWLAGLNFCEARINPMSAADRDRFIKKWHEAVAEQLRRDKRLSEAQPLDDMAAGLIKKLGNSPPIARLATNPLLCGIICALHRDRQQAIPDTQIELCEDLCKMLLHRREQESHLDTAKLSSVYARLTYGQKKAVAQELAHFMVRNEESSVTVVQADTCLREALSRFDENSRIAAKVVRDGFLERSGLLRESEPGRLDFVHNTLKEFLAGERFAALGDEGQLVPHALEPNWQPTILFAAASATPGFADRLVERLLNMDAADLARMRRWLGGADPSRAHKLFAVRCGEMALHLEQETRQRLKEILEDSNRPLTISEAESFAALGDFIVPHLGYDPSLPARTLVACVRSLTLIGTPAAKNCLKTYCGERRTTVVSELKQVLDPLELLVVQEQLQPVLQYAPSVQEELQHAPLSTVLRGRATLEFDSLPDLDLTPLT